MVCLLASLRGRLAVYRGDQRPLPPVGRTPGGPRGAKYTRSRRPVELVYQEMLPDRSAALRREAAIKRLPRTGKLALLEAVRPDNMFDI